MAKLKNDTKVPDKCQGCDLVVIDNDGSYIKCTIDCNPYDDEDMDCPENTCEW